MIQVRCPECGYLQSLSEDRFLSITEDYLECPHCHSRVPKEWQPDSGESVPEDALHKMLAFSRRILNSGEISLELVYALESLVRRYGSVEESSKALGIGYASLGDVKKAEEFLVEAREEDPADIEIRSTYLSVLLDIGRFPEAVKEGQSIVSSLGRAADDEDVARLALALIGSRAVDDAKALMDGRADLDRRNPLVKQARRELNRALRPSLASYLPNMRRLNHLLGGRKGDGLTKFKDKTAGFFRPAKGSGEDHNPSSTNHSNFEMPSKGEKEVQGLAAIPITWDYWIYSPDESVPGVDDILEAYVEKFPDGEPRQRARTFLTSYLESGRLKIDFMLRQNVEELFHYPEDLIPRNSRGFEQQDKQTLMGAQVIVRIRLSVEAFQGIDYIPVIVGFAEAARSLVGGVVQDAASHTLWGTEQWKQCVVADPLRSPIQSHVRLESLAEGTAVWIHSHGMQKFGLPEIEMESIPRDLAAAALNLMTTVGRTLLEARDKGLDYNSPLKVGSTPYQFMMEARPADEESHFPWGSLRIFPYVSAYDPHSEDTARHVLKLISSDQRTHISDSELSFTPTPARSAPKEAPKSETDAARKRLLEAHRRAKSELVSFKKSFKDDGEPGEEMHVVKIGFPAQDGKYEWMWVSLDEWRGVAIVGHLQNDPVLRKDLQKGSEVHLSEGEIFDWAIIAQSGTLREGAFTERIRNVHTA
jgi:uncharacterized protein YegJ (DUF2314 family)/tetratricopeptide (TPR) repeat protein